MAGADDDFEKLLREVAVPSAGHLGRFVQPGRRANRRPLPPAPGWARGMAAAVPWATAIGAVWGRGRRVFFVLPFLHSVSGALGAFIAAFSVSFLGRLRR